MIIRWIKRFVMWICQSITQRTLFYVPTNSNLVALTIDDSPTDSTIDILNILDRYNVKATFFIIGRNAQELPEVVEEIVNRGHEIGNHSLIDEASFRNTQNMFRNHVMMTKNIIDSFTTVPSKLFRAGSGITCSWMYNILSTLGYEFVVNNKTYNAVSTSAHAFDVNVPRYCVDNVCSTCINWSIKAGDIIDIHDRDYTQNELINVIEYAINHGYRLVKLTDLINFRTSFQNDSQTSFR